MKILLMCGAGASSGFMAQAMRKAAKAQGLEEIEIIARSDAEMMNNIKGTDLIMFGPHLEYKKDALENDLKPYNIPFTFISKDAYGSIDGEAALKQALDVLNSVADRVEAQEEKAEEKTVSEAKTEVAAAAEKTDEEMEQLKMLCDELGFSALQDEVRPVPNGGGSNMTKDVVCLKGCTARHDMILEKLQRQVIELERRLETQNEMIQHMVRTEETLKETIQVLQNEIQHKDMNGPVGQLTNEASDKANSRAKDVSLGTRKNEIETMFVYRPARAATQRDNCPFDKEN